MKLGKLPRTLDRRTLRIENYLDLGTLPQLPVGFNQYRNVSKLTIAGNDNYGDCVVAGAVHQTQAWTSLSGKEVIVPDKKVVSTYLDITGGQDTGLNMLEFLKWWRKHPIAGHGFDIFTAIDPKNEKSLKYGIFLFGGVLLGLSLPLSAQDQKVWDVPQDGPYGYGAPNSWGGHCVQMGRYGKDFAVYTWGQYQSATFNFIQNYCDEAYVCISLDWFTKEHKTPQGFYYRDLLADVKRLTL